MEETLSTILELAVSQGIWAMLYIYLFFKMLKENKEREERYQSTIDRLSTNIETGIEKIQDQLRVRGFFYYSNTNSSMYTTAQQATATLKRLAPFHARKMPTTRAASPDH